ncbi:hypothetical protein [Schauerella aestuarii]|uniref:hypothetical protein n=1 Tax=Schauerella aestuarii TaxID=2511204 RepID=UPI001F456632|nr:hypothetical protein [Achromobacter aestuarii]
MAVEADATEAGDEAACTVNAVAQAIDRPNTSTARVIANKVMRHPPEKKRRRDHNGIAPSF